MIPNILKGVIASSWLRASDQLRAPNGITTGQELPEVAVVIHEEPRAETWVMVDFVSAVQPALPIRLDIVTTGVMQRLAPVITVVQVVALLKKV